MKTLYKSHQYLQCSLGVVLAFAVSATSMAQDFGLPMTAPEQVGMSTERLERIRPAMQKYIDDN